MKEFLLHKVRFFAQKEKKYKRGEKKKMQSLTYCSLVAGGIVKLSDEKQQKISHDLQFDGGRVVQFHLGVLSTYSYLLCSCDAALLIDPGRDVNSYEEYLFENNIELCGVFLTHIHTDYVSGHIEAGTRFNVPIFLSRTADAGFRHIPLDDDTSFTLGRLKLHFYSTPEHAAEGISMTAGTQEGHPEIIFAGDALTGTFSDNSGIDRLCRMAGTSENIRIYPAHELTGPDKNWTTPEKLKNTTVSAGQHPLHLENLREINRRGPEIVNWENIFPYTEPDITLASPERHVIDIRNCSDYAKGHIPYSLNIESNGKMEYWTAKLIPPPQEVFLAGDNEMALTETAQRLQNVGFRTKGFLFEKWEQKNLPVLSSVNIDVQELDTLLWSEEAPLVLDVRTAEEWQKSRLPGSINIPLDELEDRLNELPHDRAIVIVCASGFRSAIAVGILERTSFRSISNLSGGLAAWLEEGKTLNSGPFHTPVPSKCGIKSPLADSAS